MTAVHCNRCDWYFETDSLQSEDGVEQVRRALGARMHETVIEAVRRVVAERDYAEQELYEEPPSVLARARAEAK